MQERELCRKALHDDDEAMEKLLWEQKPWNEWDTGRDGKFRFDPKLHPARMRK